MLESLKKLEQSEQQKAMRAISEVFDKFNFESLDKENRILFAKVQQQLIDEYAEKLEEQERQLVEEFNRMVIEMSAKIAATRSLLFELGREVEKRAGIARQYLVKDTNENVG